MARCNNETSRAAARVRRYLERFGFRIELVELPSLGNCPFDSDLDLIWSKKLLRVDPDRWKKPDADLIAEIIHEAGHALTSRKTPRKSDEWSFFGWESAVASRCRVSTLWRYGQRDYSIVLYENTSRKEVVAFGTLDSQTQRTVLQERRGVATAAGLIVDGNPVSVR